jgi:hypothetical protein
MIDWQAYLVLVLVGFLPNEIWRMLGVVLVRGVDERSEVIAWVRAVATAVLAGVVAQLLVFPTGSLAAAPLALRIGAALCGLAAFLLVRRSVFAGVVAGEAVLFAGMVALAP